MQVHQSRLIRLYVFFLFLVYYSRITMTGNLGKCTLSTDEMLTRNSSRFHTRTTNIRVHQRKLVAVIEFLHELAVATGERKGVLTSSLTVSPSGCAELHCETTPSATELHNKMDVTQEVRCRPQAVTTPTTTKKPPQLQHLQRQTRAQPSDSEGPYTPSPCHHTASSSTNLRKMKRGSQSHMVASSRPISSV